MHMMRAARMFLRLKYQLNISTESLNQIELYLNNPGLFYKNNTL